MLRASAGCRAIVGCSIANPPVSVEGNYDERRD
jgi:hypothetical protein